MRNKKAHELRLELHRRKAIVEGRVERFDFRAKEVEDENLKKQYRIFSNGYEGELRGIEYALENLERIYKI